ncbi:MAG: hypothetical protein MHPSP_000223 [Paramarteilia canceri]
MVASDQIEQRAQDDDINAKNTNNQTEQNPNQKSSKNKKKNKKKTPKSLEARFPDGKYPEGELLNIKTMSGASSEEDSIKKDNIYDYQLNCLRKAAEVHRIVVLNIVFNPCIRSVKQQKKKLNQALIFTNFGIT